MFKKFRVAFYLFKKELSVLVLVVALFLGCVLAYKAYSMYVASFPSFLPVDEKRDAWGQMGDFFGGMLNPIFSFLGLLFLLHTIFQNRQELMLTRMELKDSSEALHDQAATLRKQKFEDTFFALLDQLNKFAEKITAEDKRGQTTVNYLTAEFIKSHYYSSQSLIYMRGELLDKNQAINQYFRILYQVLKFIAVKCDGTNFKDEFNPHNILITDASPDEKFYSNIVRSFIGEDLHYLLAINCCAINDDDQFMKYRRLIERYEFLEHINLNFTKYENISINEYVIKCIVNHYDKKAFGKNLGYLKIFNKSFEEII